MQYCSVRTLKMIPLIHSGITIDKDMWKQIFRVCFKTIKDNDLI